MVPKPCFTGFRGALRDANKRKWNFEKAHSILHKVREIVLWGNSDNTSCQDPEVIFSYVLIHSWYILVYTVYIQVKLGARPADLLTNQTV